nr:aspartate 1-decarboxylase [uncultured Amphritea sp.]
MLQTFLKTKLHRVTVTHAELYYEGSCAIDGVLLERSGIKEYEQIHIYNVNNGERFTTYAIRAEDNSGIISVNGAAAHRASKGDLLIICSYVQLDEQEAAGFKPTLCYFENAKNENDAHRVNQEELYKRNVMTGIKNSIQVQSSD